MAEHQSRAARAERAERAEREEASCGHEIARDAEVPELLGKLMAHVAENMVVHARWVRESGEAGTAEERGLLEVAGRYRAIASASELAAGSMRAMHDVPRVPHDLERLDRDALKSWMKTKVGLQRKLAHLLLTHAEMSEAVLQKMSQSHDPDEQEPD